MYNIRLGDCHEELQKIAPGTIDMVLVDPPYATTDCEWDIMLNWDVIWEQIWRVTKPNGAVLIFSQLPFGAKLIMQQLRLYRYEWIWEKVCPVGFLNSHKMPLRAHENILVFYRKLPTYNPQTEKGKPRGRKRVTQAGVYGKMKHLGGYVEGSEFRYPRDIITFAQPVVNSAADFPDPKIHPTQKPVALLSFLIRAYTNSGDTVLDFCMGSGSTGVACIETKRNFIGIEQELKYYNAAEKRLLRSQELKDMALFDEY